MWGYQPEAKEEDKLELDDVSMLSEVTAIALCIMNEELTEENAKLKEKVRELEERVAKRNESSSKEANEKISRMEEHIRYLSHAAEIAKLRIEGTQVSKSKGEVKALSEKCYILNGERTLDLQSMSLLTIASLIFFDVDWMEALFDRSNKEDKNLMVKMLLANDLCKDCLDYNPNLMMGSVHLRALLSLISTEKVWANQFMRYLKLEKTVEQTIRFNAVYEEKLIEAHEMKIKEEAWRVVFEENLDNILNLWEEALPLVADEVRWRTRNSRKERCRTTLGKEFKQVIDGASKRTLKMKKGEK
eukprot:Gb_01533 [translate_table: standard]